MLDPAWTAPCLRFCLWCSEIEPWYLAIARRVSDLGRQDLVAFCRWCVSVGVIKLWPYLCTEAIYSPVWSNWDESVSASKFWAKVLNSENVNISFQVGVSLCLKLRNLSWCLVHKWCQNGTWERVGDKSKFHVNYWEHCSCLSWCWKSRAQLFLSAFQPSLIVMRYESWEKDWNPKNKRLN